MVVDKELNKKEIDKYRKLYGYSNLPYNEIDELLLKRHTDLEKWTFGRGYISPRYKRCTIPANKRFEYARLGAIALASFLRVETKFFFNQCLLVGASLSGDYDTIYVCCPSQYGKSFVIGHFGALYAYMKRKDVKIVAKTQKLTLPIMENVLKATTNAENDVISELVQDGTKSKSVEEKIKKLQQTTSKGNVSYKNGGGVSVSTLADTYKDNSSSGAMGVGSCFIVDEAANISDEALSETERRHLANKDGAGSNLGVLISNPHKKGTFYNHLLEEAKHRVAVIWIDALTALEEGSYTLDMIYKTDWYMQPDKRQIYWLCEIIGDAIRMFPDPKIAETKEEVFTEEELENCKVFFGIDSAYTGADNIEICCLITNGDKFYIDSLSNVVKTKWVIGKTENEVAELISTLILLNGADLTCIDLGFGEWLVSRLVEKRLAIKGIRFQSKPTKERVRAGHTQATTATLKRDEMYLDFQRLLQLGKVYMPKSAFDKIKEFLPDITLSYTPKAKVRPKQEIKALHKGKSPDEIDAIILAIHSAILYYLIYS